MNLWVKRTGQLLLAALFLMACEDESSLLGFKNPISKFEVQYIEIPLESSVFFIDTVSTTNFSGETNRLMVGAYNDPTFGIIKTIGYTQLIPRSAIKADANSVVDSVTLELRFDFYQYGPGGTSAQSFQVHELTERIYTDSLLYYNSNSSIPYNENPLGFQVYNVDYQSFKTQFEKNNADKDTTAIRFTLDNSFGEKLMERAKAGDSTYTRVSEFTKYIYGLAIVPINNDRIVGFDNNSLDIGSSLSKVIVHYHTDTKDSLELTFNIGGAQFTRVEANRSSTELSGLTVPYQEVVYPELRYEQAGTGILTKLDFTNFFNFTDNHPHMIINSSELVISGIETPTTYAPIDNFTLQVLNSDNTLKKAKVVMVPIKNSQGDTISYSSALSTADLEEINKYMGTVNNNSSNGLYTVIGDAGSFFTLSRSTSNSYSGYLTLFAQQLYNMEKKDDEPFRYFALYPNSPQIGKSVNRIIFNKDNIKLKVYYTLPKVNE